MAPTPILFLSILSILILSVLPDADGVSTVSKVAVQSGDSVTIPCLYDRIYENSVKYWCKGYYLKMCSTVVRTDSPRVNGKTSITDDPTHHVFTVTMTNLEKEHSGYYWCAVDFWFLDEGARVYLSVTEGLPRLWVAQQEVVGVEGGHVSVSCHYDDWSRKEWCRAGDFCVGVNSGESGRTEIKHDRYREVFTVTMRDLNRDDTGWYWCAAGDLQIPVHMTVTQKTTTTTVTQYTDGVSTVRKVAEQRGCSVTIPCLYDREYVNLVKYWCKAYSLRSCITVVQTDSPKVKGETSITDDSTHHVFTVTMTNLKKTHSGYYWCAVKSGGHSTLVKGARLYLSVTEDTPGLWVDQQEVVGVEGGNVSVSCHYDDQSNSKKWCSAGGSCVGENSGESGRTEIKDDHSIMFFTVTMRQLSREDAGWYWCAAGELQIPVHITVTQKTTTTTVPTSAQSSASTATTATVTTKLSISKRSTVPAPLTSVPEKTGYDKRSPDLTIALTILGMLLLGVAVATVTWKLCQRNKGLQPHTGAREDRRNEPKTVGSGDEVTYSTVALSKSQSSSKRIVGSGDEVTYSTVVLHKSQSSSKQCQPSEHPADEVMYSSLILQDLQTTHSSLQSDRDSNVIYSSVAGQKMQ